MPESVKKRAIIIGAGPAGLTAAYELLARTDIIPVVYELSHQVGGLSKTIQYHGNRMDIGGHRFFSKSDRVMRWWQEMLPLAPSQNGETGADASDRPITITYHRQQTTVAPGVAGSDPAHPDEVFLVRNRLSRIYFLRKFFKYPLSFSWQTFRNLGLARLLRILTSYFWIRMRPIRPETSLADFFINRFGRELYLTFFKDYTEKVWGVPCTKISAEWGAQRIKGLSVRAVIRHAWQSVLHRKDKNLEQKKTETSLIEKFLYPKFGPGQMWEKVARLVLEKGGEIHFGYEAKGLVTDGRRIVAAKFWERARGQEVDVAGDYFFSTMPVRELVLGLTPPAPEAVRAVAAGLMYRDFITVGLLVKKMKASATGERGDRPGSHVPDNWIYIQERDVRLGRLQVFNNWSPYLVRDPSTVWLGLEYFCQEGDELWNKSDTEFKQFAIDELVKIDMIERADVLEATVAREPKTYPAYFGTYDQFPVVRDYLDQFTNLFLVGRNGMHRYNNQDHSMLTAMVAVDNIVAGLADKSNIWAVNTEEAYHEEK